MTPSRKLTGVPSTTVATSSDAAPAARHATEGRPAREGVMLAVSVVTALLVAAVGGYLGGENYLFGPSNALAQPQSWVISTLSAHPASPDASASVPGSVSASASSSVPASVPGALGQPVSGASASAQQFDQSSVYACPNDAVSDYWACLGRARAVPGGLTISFAADFELTAGQDAYSHHVHLFLANPGPGGGTVPPVAIMQHVAHPGSWFNVYSNGTTVVNNSTERGGLMQGIDTTKYSLLCIRVVTGLHSLTFDRSGGYFTGNCVQITH
jgi:hypothetical protein